MSRKRAQRAICTGEPDALEEDRCRGRAAGDQLEVQATVCLCGARGEEAGKVAFGYDSGRDGYCGRKQREQRLLNHAETRITGGYEYSS